MNKYLVFFKTIDDDYRCLFNDDHYETLKTLPEACEYHHYEIFKGFEATDAGLVDFRTNLIKWNEELKHNGF